MRLLLHAFPLLFAACSATAQYQGPESAEYDPVGDRWFVSNTQSNRIKVRAADGSVTDFALTPNAPYGLEIMGDVLYACMGNGVRGYSLATAAEVYVRNLGASFPNGITSDGQFLYITDFNNSARRIYKVDPVADTHSTLVSGLPGQPNGIVYLPGTEELLVAFWGANASVRSYERNTGDNIGNVGTTLGNIDGITLDCNGDVLIASWSPARITRFGWGISSPVFQNLNVSGLGNPADIDFDPVNRVLGIPSSSLNTLVLWDLSADCVTGVERTAVEPVLVVMPNPASDKVWLRPAPAVPTAYTLHDTTGRACARGVVTSEATIPIAVLPPGVYTLHLEGVAGNWRVVRQ
jgi:hypothetical protein